MKILIDYDDSYQSRGGAWRHGWKLIRYAVLSKLGFNPRGDDEADSYLLTLVRLNALCGVETVVGLRDVVEKAKPYLRGNLSGFKVDVRRHVHIGENSDPNRRRIWDPPLHQSRATWHYDRDYAAGRKPRLEAGELPVFHADYPYLIGDYIRFLYEWKVLGISPYGEGD